MDNVYLLILALVLGFGIAAISGKFILPMLRTLQVGQRVRNDGPKTHLKKAGTPTFGGFIFLGAFTIVVSMYLIYDFQPIILATLLFVLAHAAIGFVDDYFNVRVNGDGLSDAKKALVLAIIQILFIVFYLYAGGEEVRILLFFREPIVVTGIWKLVYGAFLFFYFFACTNAVNIVDGIDGLASSVTIVTLAFTAITAYLFHKNNFGTASSLGVSIVSLVMLGALGGFLIYNWHKAKCFMGDLGSLALGALTSVTLLILEMPWVFVLAGIMYVVDIATVLIQTTYFKMTGGKRIFKMTPIHHQFEIEGWSEVKVVILFSVIQLIGSVLSALIVWPSIL